MSHNRDAAKALIAARYALDAAALTYAEAVIDTASHLYAYRAARAALAAYQAAIPDRYAYQAADRAHWKRP
jgi:hypothetical protein